MDDQVYPFATAGQFAAGGCFKTKLATRLELTLSAHLSDEISEPKQVRVPLNIQRLLHGGKSVAC